MKTIEDNISAWEAEGGSLRSESLLTASVGRQKRAEGIGAQVNAKFDRVSNALETLALMQPYQNRLRIFAIMLILEERRGEVLLSERGTCFLHDWQERAIKLGESVKPTRPH